MYILVLAVKFLFCFLEGSREWEKEPYFRFKYRCLKVPKFSGEYLKGKYMYKVRTLRRNEISEKSSLEGMCTVKEGKTTSRTWFRYLEGT